MNKKNRIEVALAAGVTALASGCVSRAPTDCELDRRAGVYPSSFCDKDAAALPRERPALVGAGIGAAEAKPASLPIREQPVVAKVWVRDQILDGGHWMQGTWLFVEVESSRWSGESVAARSEGGKRLGARRVNFRSRSFNPVYARSATVEPGESATRSERGGKQ